MSVKYIKISDILELNDLVAVFNAIRAYEAWQCHGQWLESNNPIWLPAIKERFFNCKDATEDEATKAHGEQLKLRQKLDELLADDSALCFPTTIDLPPLKLASAEASSAKQNSQHVALRHGLAQWISPNFNTNFSKQS
jgi:hypothetical protein